MKTYQTRNKLVHGLFAGKHFKHMLYVGTDPAHRPTDYRFIRKMAHRITCIEAWQKNVDLLKARSWFDDVLLGDITTWVDFSEYDIAVWWHGPEHVEVETAKRTVIKLRATVPVVWLATPWGESQQSEVHGNPYNTHRSYWYPELYQDCGYSVAGFGGPGRKGSYLLAWSPPEEYCEALSD